MDEARQCSPLGGGSDRWTYFVAGTVATVIALTAGAVYLADGHDPRHDRPGPRHPQVVVVPDAAIDSLPTRGSHDLVLKGSWDKIVRGDFLTAELETKSREGFLLKALSKDESDDRTTVRTEAASLYEAEPAGDLVVNPSDFAREPGLLSLAPVPVDEAEETPLVPTAFRDVKVFGGLHPHLKCEEPPDELELKPSFTPDFKPHFDLRWNNRKGLRKRIETAEAGLLGALRAAVTGSIDGSFDCTLEPALKIPLFKAVAPAGPVPVPVKVFVTVEPTVSGDLGSKVEGTIAFGLAGSAAVEYGDGHLSPSGTLTPKLDVEPPKFESGAEASLGVKPAITILVGWRAPWLGELAASAGLSLPSTVKLTYDALADHPAPEACFQLAMRGTLKFHLPKPIEWLSPKRSATHGLLGPECHAFGAPEAPADAAALDSARHHRRRFAD